ncbi:hypothetical protein NHQ30_008757 [Ciborinia camelliae]|nr:hypothetical protein NHQ30_008757 [Ciborinia camelliae]
MTLIAGLIMNRKVNMEDIEEALETIEEERAAILALFKKAIRSLPLYKLREVMVDLFENNQTARKYLDDNLGGRFCSIGAKNFSRHSGSVVNPRLLAHVAIHMIKSDNAADVFFKEKLLIEQKSGAFAILKFN